MKTINEENYYTKQDIADMMGCALATISVRISKMKMQGYYMGKCKHYTMEQVKQIAEYRNEPATPTKAKKTTNK